MEVARPRRQWDETNQREHEAKTHADTTISKVCALLSASRCRAKPRAFRAPSQPTAAAPIGDLGAPLACPTCCLRLTAASGGPQPTQQPIASTGGGGGGLSDDAAAPKGAWADRNAPKKQPHIPPPHIKVESRHIRTCACAASEAHGRRPGWLAKRAMTLPRDARRR